MTRFAADTRDERLALVADGIAAHRERASPFVTVEAEPGPNMAVAPWVQYAADEGLLNLDCRGSEVDAVASAIESFGGATITERHSPEEAEGTNLRVAIRGDPERVAMLVDSIFRDGFGLPAGYRAWVTAI